MSPRFPNEPVSVPATDYSRPKIEPQTLTDRVQSDVNLSNPLRKEPLHDPNLNPDIHSNSSDEVQAFAERNFEDIEGVKVGSILFKDGKQDETDRLRSVDSIGRQRASRYGMNHSINIKCKNMRSYDVVYSTERSNNPRTPRAVLTREPAILPGGATIPTSIFRDPQ